MFNKISKLKNYRLSIIKFLKDNNLNIKFSSGLDTEYNTEDNEDNKDMMSLL